MKLSTLRTQTIYHLTAAKRLLAEPVEGISPVDWAEITVAADHIDHALAVLRGGVDQRKGARS